MLCLNPVISRPSVDINQNRNARFEVPEIYRDTEYDGFFLGHKVHAPTEPNSTFKNINQTPKEVFKHTEVKM